MTKTEAAAWDKLAKYFNQLAAERADEGTGIQLACLVLAQYSVHEWSGDHGGPSREMVALAENTVGACLDELFAAELARVHS